MERAFKWIETRIGVLQSKITENRNKASCVINTYDLRILVDIAEYVAAIVSTSNIDTSNIAEIKQRLESDANRLLATYAGPERGERAEKKKLLAEIALPSVCKAILYGRSGGVPGIPVVEYRVNTMDNGLNDREFTANMNLRKSLSMNASWAFQTEPAMRVAAEVAVEKLKRMVLYEIYGEFVDAILSLREFLSEINMNLQAPVDELFEAISYCSGIANIISHCSRFHVSEVSDMGGAMTVSNENIVRRE